MASTYPRTIAVTMMTIPIIESAVSNFYKVENAYFFEMYNIEEKSGSVIEEEHLSEVEKELTRLKGEISTFIQNMNAEIKAVNHIVSLDSVDVGDFEDSIDSFIKISKKLRKDFETYEKSKLIGSSFVDFFSFRRISRDYFKCNKYRW